MRLRRYQAAFAALWAAERAADVATTWYAVRLGGVESNRILRALMEEAGLEPALALWLALTVALGLLLAVGVPHALRRAAVRAARGRVVAITPIDRAILESYGPEGAAKLILALALALGSVGPLANGLCLARAALAGRLG